LKALKPLAALAAAGLVVALAAAAASAQVAGSRSPAAAATKGKIAVLLPDTQSSSRWENDDRRYFTAAFKKAKIGYIISNAQGSRTTQQTQAEQAITNGAKVILLVNLDSGSGAAIEAQAKAKGVKTIDYDRLTLKGTAAYYVSFNNVTVGKLQGQGLVNCLKANGSYGKKPVIAELNGSPTDNNATLFKQGYDSVLKPLYSKGTFKKGPDQSVPDWDNQKALTIFEQMLAKENNKIDGVDAANDGLGNAVISALKSRHLKNIPVTGQDATAQGIQHILAGEQCMTVYKPIKAEADAASKLAIQMINGKKVTGVNGKSDAQTRQVPSILLKPIAVTKKNIKQTVIKDGFRKWSEICIGSYKKYCPKH
jgi:D-xylose transport system substrate-binding protein